MASRDMILDDDYMETADHLTIDSNRLSHGFRCVQWRRDEDSSPYSSIERGVSLSTHRSGRSPSRSLTPFRAIYNRRIDIGLKDGITTIIDRV